MSKNKQMGFLFLSSFSILCVGFGLFPLLPVYATNFGATPSMVGLYLALTYISITIGSMLAGWLSGRFPRKLTLLFAGGLGVAALALLGGATTLWQVVILTGLVWFTGGVGLAVINVLTGLNTEASNRGRWFGLIALTNPLGAVIGGLLVTWLVEGSGYPLMFLVMAAEYAIWPLAGILLIEDKPVTTPGVVRNSGANPDRPGNAFLWLLLAALLAAMAVSVNRLGMSLVMKAQAFQDGAISAANVIGGLVTLPVVYYFGTLSDRLGRKLFLGSGYLLAALGGVALVGASQLWQFWLVSAATLVSRTISNSLASALATDLLTPTALGKNLPWVGSANWIAGVIGFAGTGVVIDLLGASSPYLIASALAIGAVVIIGMLPSKPAPPQVPVAVKKVRPVIDFQECAGVLRQLPPEHELP